MQLSNGTLVDDVRCKLLLRLVGSCSFYGQFCM